MDEITLKHLQSKLTYKLQFSFKNSQPTSFFTKLPWPEDSEWTFLSSSQTATCLPHTVEASHCPFNAER